MKEKRREIRIPERYRNRICPWQTNAFGELEKGVLTFLNELYLQMCLDRQVPVKVSWTWKILPDPNNTYIEIGNLFPILENTKDSKPLR